MVFRSGVGVVWWEVVGGRLWGWNWVWIGVWFVDVWNVWVKCISVL